MKSIWKTQSSQKQPCLTTTSKLLNERISDYIHYKIFFECRNIIDSFGMVIWSLFVGSFLDKFSGGTILILALNIAGDLFSTFVFLIGTGVYYSSTKWLFLQVFISLIV